MFRCVSVRNIARQHPLIASSFFADASRISPQTN
jgi:hypothetical protein